MNHPVPGILNATARKMIGIEVPKILAPGQIAPTMQVEVACGSCSYMYTYLMDTVVINGHEVQFVACFRCYKGYTRCDKELELIT